jgi:hypothetical protein
MAPELRRLPSFHPVAAVVLHRFKEKHMADQATETTVETPKKKREMRSINVRLTGDGQGLHIRAFKLTEGRWRSELIITTGTGKKATRERGNTDQHADLAAAKAAVEKLTKDAEKAGWQRKPTRSFERKADAFSGIPKPKSAKK